MWDQKESRAIDMVKWDASAGDWQASGLLPKRVDEKVRPLPNALMERFRAGQCWAGVDLSMTTDLSVVSLVFPCDDDFDVLAFFWMPEQAVRQRERRDGMPYARSAEQGFLSSFRPAT
jgi:phage terminase large subunit-like protein